MRIHMARAGADYYSDTELQGVPVKGGDCWETFVLKVEANEDARPPPTPAPGRAEARLFLQDPGLRKAPAAAARLFLQLTGQRKAPAAEASLFLQVPGLRKAPGAAERVNAPAAEARLLLLQLTGQRKAHEA
ncbi:hypothetical protein NDU88_000477 [Pleurodeles waltl]|uniref:Uncharacterized protein n=1 Tax=Pleurodeles waltl TaxID=8319 RepID=A0AAV7V6W5_PLEWA|nr:hypothetical protein NDU88_000477 [Pleurodeles waltl]